MSELKHIYPFGLGKTKEEAALKFVDDLQKYLPDSPGEYRIFIRHPIRYVFLDERMDDEYISTPYKHSFTMRMSYVLVEKHKEPEGEICLK